MGIMSAKTLCQDFYFFYFVFDQNKNPGKNFLTLIIPTTMT